MNGHLLRPHLKSIQGRVFCELPDGTASRRRILLVLAFLVLAAAVWLAESNGTRVRYGGYDVQLAAALRMERCMEAVRGYKAERGLALSPLDWHGTGMMGGDFNGLTTTSGSPDAKRTTANSDMAALAVRMLTEAGVRPGDKAALGLSGSFPAMNLAVLCACAEMEVEAAAIVSVGASTHGANQTELTFPEMYLLLIRDGLLPNGLTGITWGGGNDCGGGMDETLREEVRRRLAGYGVEPFEEPDYTRNLDRRMALYEKDGLPSCFVSVGGNLTSLGRDQDSPPQGLIRPDGRMADRGDKNGMLERYHQSGLPVISFLGIKRLTAEYGMPYDPVSLEPPGEASIYFVTAYPRGLILSALLSAALLLALYARGRGRRQ